MAKLTRKYKEWQPIDKIKFIDGKENNGIVINWDKIRNDFRKLKTPNQFYNPCNIPFESTKYNIILTDRAVGKTTQLLLIALCLYRRYGVRAALVRQNKDMFKSMYMSTLFNTILLYNDKQYMHELFGDNGYNNIVYYNHEFYLSRWENGEEIYRDPTPFLRALSVDNTLTYKSGLQLNNTDLIIYDEFIGYDTTATEVYKFFDLVSTIIRQRYSPVIIMLANTITPFSPYFEEMEIQREVGKMHTGEKHIYTTSKGSKIYFEICGVEVTQKKRELNSLFFGFKSGKLASITGESEFAFADYPKIKKMDREIVYNNIYFEHYRPYKIDIVYNDTLGYHALIHTATPYYNEDTGKFYKDDSIILTTNKEQVYDDRYITYGGNNIIDILVKLWNTDRVFFDYNETGNTFTEFLYLTTGKRYK